MYSSLRLLNPQARGNTWETPVDKLINVRRSKVVQKPFHDTNFYRLQHATKNLRRGELGYLRATYTLIVTSPASNSTKYTRAIMSLLFAAGALLLATVFLWKFIGFLEWYYRACKAMRFFPRSPKAHWLWGILFVLKPDEETMLKAAAWVHDNGYSVTSGWLGPLHPVISVNHPDEVRKVMKEPKNRDTYSLLVPWLGEGLLISEGQTWARSRRLLTPAFHFEILKLYTPIYNSGLRTLLNKWSISAAENKPVKLFDTISLMSLDIILQCAFSYKSNCQTAKTRIPYIRSVYELIEHVAVRFYTPIYFLDFIYYLSPEGRRFKRACKVVHDHSEKVIRERKKALGLHLGRKDKAAFGDATKQRKYPDFLDVLLMAVDEDGNGLTDLEIRNETDTFMFEGHDTTTSGMSWTLYCLAKYPEHQEKVREEVRNVLDGREWLEYDDLKELKYTQWCIKEALRLYPPVFLIFRETSKEIELGGHTIPEGVMVLVPMYTVHQNPKIWKNPKEFDPLRFHPDNAEGRDPFAYLPFSAGQRNCIGQNFAMNEMRTVVASIVHRFSLSLTEDHQVEMVPKVILRTMYDIKLDVKLLQ